MSNDTPRTVAEYREWWAENTNEPYGFCHCSCGGKTGLAPGTDRRRLWFKSEPIRYIRGHAGYNKGREEYTVNPETGCWVWNRAQGREREWGTYGNYYENGRYRLAHIVIYERHHGPLPPDTELHHRCVEEGYGTTLCVNPEHLEPVTHEVNCQRGANAKVNPDSVRLIRRLYATRKYTQAAIGRLVGLRQAQVSAIVRGEAWSNIR